jgi:hypothetical protein
MIDRQDPQTGLQVQGREIIDDQVLLADFDRFVEIGERWEQDELEGIDRVEVRPEVWELPGFIDRHGRQLLELAKRGAEMPGEEADNQK